jgi:hypothetical protein
VSVYKYTVVLSQREDTVESGTVVAKSETEAKKKLQRLDLNNPKLKKVTGLSGFFGRITADVK